MATIAITNPRIKDNEYLWEAFSGINNARVYSDFRISDNYWIYLAILAMSTGDMQILGDIDCSGNPNYPAATSGFVYRVSVAGKIGGGAGMPVSAGNLLVCFTTSVAGTQAAVGANWNITNVGLQRVFEVGFTTGDLTETVVRDWTGTIGRNVSMAIVGNDTYTVGGNYSLIATGTWAVSGTNFAVATNSKVTAGIANGSMTVGLSAGFNAALANNTAIGVGVLNLVAGTGNTGVGAGALSRTTANDSTAVGRAALLNATSGLGNEAFGADALANLTTGQYNVGIGNGTLLSKTTGVRNTAVGNSAGNSSGATGNDNVYIGFNSGNNGNNNGANNVYVGSGSGQANSGSGNIFIGMGNAGGSFPALSNTLIIDVGDNAVPYLFGNITNKNLALNGSSWGTNAVGVFSISNGTPPTTSPIDMIQIFSTDISAGNASLGLRTEQTVSAVGLEVPTNFLLIKINGTTYKMLLST